LIAVLCTAIITIMNVYFLAVFLSILSVGTILYQPDLAKTSVVETSVAMKKEENIQPARIKWTWKLPLAVKKSFYKSRFSNWLVEKMIRYRSDEKIIYRFYLNNGNLLDGDHYDSFLRADSLDIADNGIILFN
jgi:hypothetical protein